MLHIFIQRIFGQPLFFVCPCVPRVYLWHQAELRTSKEALVAMETALEV